jgi:hypothetical protein
LVGVNDLAISIDDPAAEPLSLETIQSEPDVRQNLVVHAGQADHIELPGLTRAAECASLPSVDPELVPVTTEFYRRQRKLRAECAGFSSEMPALDPFLAEYARNLAVIDNLVRARGALPVFISQPSLWSAYVPAETEALFWWGAVDGWPAKTAGGYYYSSAALDRMLTAYNQRLQLMAKQQNILLIDVAEKLLKNPKYYYDQIHFNEAGSGRDHRHRAGLDHECRDECRAIEARSAVQRAIAFLLSGRRFSSASRSGGMRKRTEREHRVDGVLAGLAATGVSCEWYLGGRDNARENAYQ